MGDEQEQKVAELEKAVAILKHEVSDIKANQLERLAQMDVLLHRCAGAIWGENGQSGVLIKVDRIEQLDIAGEFRAIRNNQQITHLKLATWGGAIGLATISMPILIKLFWP